MRRKWVYVGGEAYEYGNEPPRESLHVIPDIAPFRSPDGAHISGRRAWREHLKRTDSVEMGHSDIQAAQVQWGKRKQDFQDRLRGSAQFVREADQLRGGEPKPFRRSGLNVEIANRLHGRPEPERKELIKLTLDLAKRMKRG